ncbi:MAG: asparagine synthase (glutamine-hydrolyzing), partial [Deltaproteobacteria bacterium]|nr:asparagine synthase (glutamine-hydrolyzing) [Deltaproteobacteria bacterium]
DRMVHRGPDDEGSHFAGPLGLGFRRLSIIDLEGGHQPMADQDASVWVVFNGEIYNFPALKEELQGYGHVFRTRSDTEVIVHGYKQWGKDVLEHLNGMFGLAIWDDRRRQLIVARDRMGIKLIYYKLTAGRLTFASELRPLLVCDEDRPEIDPVAVSLFLRYRYTPSPLTVLRGIRKLAPGTRLVVRANEAPIVERWWNFQPEPFDPMPSDAEAEEQLLDLYKQAIKRQLISDVPLGLLLSGGLDSGLLLALMHQHGSPRNTYTVGYGKSFADDELSDAAHTAELLGARHASLEIDRETFAASLPSILTTLEEPIASSSIVPMYHVCRRARQDVKVVFMGQGPDELFGGYTRHLGVRYGASWRSLPGWLRAPLTPILGGLARAEWIRRGLYALAAPERMERYQRVLSIVPGEHIDELFHRDVLAAGASDGILDCWKDLEPLMAQTDELGGLQFLEVRSSLPDELLMYADKLSMAHGLEVRVPYLDQEIVQFVERLSASFKVRGGTRKWIHRQVCRLFLPPEIIRRKKRGFAVNVVDDWFRTSLAQEMDDLLLDRGSLIYGFLRPETVSRTLQNHKSGQQDNHKILFSLVVLEHLLRSYRAAPARSTSARERGRTRARALGSGRA